MECLINTYNDTVDRGMHAEGFTDDGIQDSEVLHVVILHGAESAVGIAVVLDLFVEELFHDVRAGCSVEEGPRGSSGTGMLAGHKESNHDVGNFVVGEGAAVLVGLAH